MSTPPPSPHDPAPESVGGYRILRRLGSGGQGTVYLGEDGTGARVAVKTLTEEAMADPGMRRRFAREAEAARKVATFCTAAVVDADMDAQPPYIVSEYVEGPTLHQRVRDRGPMSGGDLNRLAVVTATALVAIHEAGIVHRDLKPGNVILGEGGARVIDFGIAQVPSGAGTVTHSTIGTPAFMAPEQIAEGDATPASDVFAWGALVAFTAGGSSPFDGPTVPTVLYKVLHADPDLSALPEPLRTLVGRALAKDPATRPTSEALLMSLLGRADPPAAPAPAPAPPPVPPTRVLDQAHTPAVDHRAAAASPTERSARPLRLRGTPLVSADAGGVIAGIILLLLLVGAIVIGQGGTG